MPRYQKYQQDDDDNDDQQFVQGGEEQGDDDEDDQQPVGAPQQQNDDDDDNDNGNDRAKVQQQGDEDDNDDDDDDSRKVQQGQQDNEDEDDHDQTAQQGGEDKDDDDDNGQSQIRQPQNDDDDEIPFPPPSPPPDEDDDDDNNKAQKAAKSATVNLNFNINLSLDNSDLHEGGTIFSKKLLAQLFSGPGKHDRNEQEIGVNDIQHEHVETHESGEWTIVELKTEDASGATIYLKAKLDSGADDNFMSFDIYTVTGLDFTPYEGPEGPPSFTTGSGEDTEPLGTVRLAYTAGIKPQKFIETFQVLEGLPHDVIIGKPLMTNAHMIMVNPNFAHSPESKKLCLLELPQKDKGENTTIVRPPTEEADAAQSASKAKAVAFQQQRAAEQKAAYEAKIRAQEAAAPKAHKRGLFGRH